MSQGRRLRIDLAYDGTEFAGWQVQPDRLTVQEVVETAIEKVTGSPGRAIASGRTDAGVHALGQVASFRSDTHLTTDVLHRALNAEQTLRGLIQPKPDAKQKIQGGRSNSGYGKSERSEMQRLIESKQ